MGQLVIYALTRIPIVLLIAWFVVMGRAIWEDRSACDGHPCGLWQDVTRKSPEKPRGYINLAQAYERKGLLNEAVRSYQQAELVSFAPERSEFEVRTTRLFARMNLSRIFLDSGQIEIAHQILKHAWIEDPGFPGYAINLGKFYILENQPEKAVWILTQGIAEMHHYPWFVDRAKLFLNRGVAYTMTKRCKEAKADFEKIRDKSLEGIPLPECEAL